MEVGSFDGTFLFTRLRNVEWDGSLRSVVPAYCTFLHCQRWPFRDCHYDTFHLWRFGQSDICANLTRPVNRRRIAAGRRAVGDKSIYPNGLWTATQALEMGREMCQPMVQALQFPY